MNSGPSTLRVQSLAILNIAGKRPVCEDTGLGVEERGIFVVADGFGGPEAGLGASRLACEAVRDFLTKGAGDPEATLPFVLRSYFSLAGNVLFNSLIHANRRLFAQNRGKGVHQRGGASVIAGYLDGNLLALANVGVCSAWLIRDEAVRELTVSRTYARLRDPFQDGPVGWQIPLMALGMSSDLEPEVFEVQIRAGDWLVLGTDGGLGHGMCEALLEAQKEAGPAAPAEAALEAIRAKAVEDNLSILLAIF